MTIKDFRDKVIAAKNKRETVEAEINDLLRLESVLAADADAAAAAGDVDLYEAKIAEKEKAERAIFVKRSFLDKTKPTLTESDAMKAWDGYSADYNRKLKKTRADFLDAKEKMLKLYSNMLELQADALRTRKELGNVVGLDAQVFKMDYIPCLSGDENGAVTLKWCSCHDPDAVFFLAEDAVKKSAKNGGRPFIPIDDPAAETRGMVCDIVLRRI